ncbi:SDR family oxidoreductase [Flavobacterium suzhouense]|uniref:SDR family oxidoreductase n=1 Tax=Flavobacterium suzhouense TaxID=1529638 RepID=A0ABW5NV39_9FLAO
MKILLTGATGYIAQRLLPVLLAQGHEVICLVRDAGRFDTGKFDGANVPLIMEADLLDSASLKAIPEDIDAAYYLVHSMSAVGEFTALEERAARNFAYAIAHTRAQQVIYLTGIANDTKLSPHLASRKNVEEILSIGSVPLTALRAGIIVGSGSASFEIIRDLVEKLPIMVAPKWLNTRCQPIAIRNVIEFLSGVLLKADTYGKHFDIYGSNILTYKEMLHQFAVQRGLKRCIITLPVMTPRLSSYWLYFVTSTSYPLARNLVDSMKVDVVAVTNDLNSLLGIKLIPYREAIELAFGKIEQDMVLSTWKDALGGARKARLYGKIKVPEFGVFTDVKTMKVTDPKIAADRIFSIGGAAGWYYGDWLWNFRGFLDKLFGGVGLKRGRKNASTISTGESLDFWRVIYSNRNEMRLLLYAEMRLPGEAWLEFTIVNGLITQTATFRPLGLLGRLYWYMVLPFHYFIFNGMIKKIAS